jgi:flagellar biosynthesis/type III secretory pathway protein FliH
MISSKTPFERDPILGQSNWRSDPLGQSVSQGFIQSELIDESSGITDPLTAEAEVVITLDEHEAAISKAEAQAFEQGYQQALSEYKAETELNTQHLNALLSALEQAMEDKDALQAPLRKLSLKLAELLVQKELSTSPAAIENLIATALDALEMDENYRIGVTVHPADLELLREYKEQDTQIVLSADGTLHRGSVKVSAGDLAVDNLFEQRLADLQGQLNLVQSDPLRQPSTTNAPAPATQSRLGDGTSLLDLAEGPKPTTTFDENWP